MRSPYPKVGYFFSAGSSLRTELKHIGFKAEANTCQTSPSASRRRIVSVRMELGPKERLLRRAFVSYQWRQIRTSRKGAVISRNIVVHSEIKQSRHTINIAQTNGKLRACTSFIAHNTHGRASVRFRTRRHAYAGAAFLFRSSKLLWSTFRSSACVCVCVFRLPPPAPIHACFAEQFTIYFRSMWKLIACSVQLLCSAHVGLGCVRGNLPNPNFNSALQCGCIERTVFFCMLQCGRVFCPKSCNFEIKIPQQ